MGTKAKKLAEALGIEIQYEQGKRIGRLLIFSTYQPKPPRIVLYPNVIAKHGQETSLDYYIAHELFHHFEAIGLIQVERGAREKAANQFAARWLAPSARQPWEVRSDR